MDEPGRPRATASFPNWVEQEHRAAVLLVEPGNVQHLNKERMLAAMRHSWHLRAVSQLDRSLIGAPCTREKTGTPVKLVKNRRPRQVRKRVKHTF